MPLALGDKISRARALLLEAMVDITRWPAALEATAEACGARAGQLIALDAAHQPTGHWISGMPEDFPTLLETHGFNPRANPRFAAGLTAPIMTLVADQDYADADTRKRSRIYQDIYGPHDLPFNCQAVLMRDENAFVRASVTRSTKQGPLDKQAFNTFAALLPHLHAAIRVQANLALNERNSILRTLDAIDAVAVLLNDDGRICGMSRPAAAMFEKGDVARIHAQRIKFASEDDTRAVAAAFSRTLLPSNERASVTSAVLLSSNLAVEVHPLPRSNLIIVGSAAALMIVRPANRVERLRILQGKYVMTVAEASVAIAIADGCTVDEIAKQRKASVATVRSQLQAVFAKAGVRRQSDLVRMWSIKT